MYDVIIREVSVTVPGFEMSEEINTQGSDVWVSNIKLGLYQSLH